MESDERGLKKACFEFSSGKSFHLAGGRDERSGEGLKYDKIEESGNGRKVEKQRVVGRRSGGKSGGEA